MAGFGVPYGRLRAGFRLRGFAPFDKLRVRMTASGGGVWRVGGGAVEVEAEGGGGLVLAVDDDEVWKAGAGGLQLGLDGGGELLRGEDGGEDAEAPVGGEEEEEGAGGE